MQDLSHKIEISHRGRPRPEETIRRDDRVLEILKSGPMSRNRIWEKLISISQQEIILWKQLPAEIQSKTLRPFDPPSPSQVWLSLDRLRRANKVKLCQGIGERVWSREVDRPCP